MRVLIFCALSWNGFAGDANLTLDSKFYAMAIHDASASFDPLVAGRDAIAKSDSPAVVIIDLCGKALSEQAQLELSIEPVTAPANERYVVTVSGQTEQGITQNLGAFSFFPPPREGIVRKFLVDLPTIPSTLIKQGKTRVQLRIALASIDQNRPLAVSAIRITSVRVVGAEC